MRRSVRVIDLTAALIDETAELLHDVFRGRSDDWQDLHSARQEVRESLSAERVSRVAIDETDRVIGWIGAIPMYSGRVWEIHPLVVARDRQRQGIGRMLIDDIERMASENGALTLFVGSDDENNQTTLSGVDLYADVARAMRDIRNLDGHPYEFYLRVGFKIVGVMPDANGIGKPDIFLAKRIH